MFGVRRILGGLNGEPTYKAGSPLGLTVTSRHLQQSVKYHWHVDNMSSITISAERIAQVEAAIRKFVDGFLKPIDSTDEFLSSYHPDVEWYDHAFLIRRVGHQAAIGLQHGFTHCNQPFDVDIKVRRRSPSVIPPPTMH